MMGRARYCPILLSCIDVLYCCQVFILLTIVLDGRERTVVGDDWLMIYHRRQDNTSIILTGEPASRLMARLNGSKYDLDELN